MDHGSANAGTSAALAAVDGPLVLEETISVVKRKRCLSLFARERGIGLSLSTAGGQMHTMQSANLCALCFLAFMQGYRFVMGCE